MTKAKATKKPAAKKAPVKRDRFTRLDREKCREAAMALYRAFYWDESPEGDTYWRKVYDRLLSLSTGEK